MKKILTVVLFIILTLFGTCVYADDAVYSDSDELSSYNADDYLPPEVTDKLEENGISIESEGLMRTALDTVIAFYELRLKTTRGK